MSANPTHLEIRIIVKASVRFVRTIGSTLSTRRSFPLIVWENMTKDTKLHAFFKSVRHNHGWAYPHMPFSAWDPRWYRLTVNQTWINNHMPSEMLDTIADLFPYSILTVILTWMYNHMPSKVCVTIAYLFQSSTAAPLKFGNGYTISYYALCRMQSLTHAGIKISSFK